MPFILGPDRFWGRYYMTARGLFRIFNTAEYRFYRSNSGPPDFSSAPFATSSSLPATPAVSWGAGTWRIGVTWFNGVFESDPLPLGPRGETYLRLDISGGADIGNPPFEPVHVGLQERAGGVVRVTGVYWQPPAGGRADEWALSWTNDGSAPTIDPPDITVELPADGLALLEYDLPAQADATTVKVALGVRRNDGGTWRYSGESVASAQAHTLAAAEPEQFIIDP